MLIWSLTALVCCRFWTSKGVGVIIASSAYRALVLDPRSLVRSISTRSRFTMVVDDDLLISFLVVSPSLVCRFLFEMGKSTALEHYISLVTTYAAELVCVDLLCDSLNEYLKLDTESVNSI